MFSVGKFDRFVLSAKSSSKGGPKAPAEWMEESDPAERNIEQAAEVGRKRTWDGFTREPRRSPRGAEAWVSSIEGLFSYLWTLCHLWLESLAVMVLGK
jgi:hypothetical protein